VFRGRVFSLGDVIFNVAFVAAAAVGAVVLPDTGKSYAVTAAVASGYLLTAVWYARAGRETRREARVSRRAGRR
jgi:predicted MFS family arabinose efflux permease